MYWLVAIVGCLQRTPPPHLPGDMTPPVAVEVDTAHPPVPDTGTPSK